MDSKSKFKIISEKDIQAEVASMKSTLNFSKVKVGPGCSGCYTIVIDSTCGHLYRYRKQYSTFLLPKFLL